MLKKIFIITITLFISLGVLGVISTRVQAEDQGTVDLDCYRQKLFNPDLDCGDSNPNLCGDMSPEEIAADKETCEKNGGSYNSANCTCGRLGGIEKLLPRTNFDGSIDDISELTRLLFTVFFMIMAIVAVFLGLYGMYVYSSAGEDAERVELAKKIFKNAILGILIAVCGILIVNIIFIFLGLDTEDVFTFKVSSTE